MDSKTYLILTNTKEIQVYNALNKYKKLSENFNSVNILKIYKAVIEILYNYNNDDINTVCNNLDVINYEQLSQGEIFWDSEYNYDNVQTQFINLVKEGLCTNDNFDKYSKGLLIKEDTNINKALQKIYDTNNNIANEIVKCQATINQLFNENESLYDKYGQEYAEVTRKYTDYQYAKIFENSIINIVNCKSSLINNVPADKTYYIIVGNKLPIYRQIENKVTTINNLYSSLVNTNAYQVEMIYNSIMIEFINIFNNDTTQTKGTLLQNIKSQSSSYASSSEEVKSEVDRFIDEVKDNNDPSYIYTPEDVNHLQTLLNIATNKFTTQTETNNNILSQIEQLNNEIDSLNQQYQEEHNGESYEHRPINETDGQPSQYTQINEIDNVYSQTIQVSIALDKYYVQIEANSTDILVATIHPSTVENKTIIWISSNPNVVSVFPERTQSGEQTQLTWVSQGNATVTAMCEYDNIKFTECNVTCAEAQQEPPVEDSYYFYIGKNENYSVITADFRVNTEGLSTYTNINDIVGRHTFDQAQYILLPESWYYQLRVENDLHYGLNADVYRVSIDNVNYIVIITFETIVNSLTFVITENGGIEGATIIDKTTGGEEPQETIYYWYTGQSNPTNMTIIDPIVNDMTSAGWRLIGTSIPTYSSSNKLYDTIVRQNDNSFIVTGTSLAKQWVALPSNSSACVRDGAGNDGTTVNICTQIQNVTLNGVEYKVYEWIGKAKKLGYDIY